MIIESWTLMAFVYLMGITIAWPVLVSLLRLMFKKNQGFNNQSKLILSKSQLILSN